MILGDYYKLYISYIKQTWSYKTCMSQRWIRWKRRKLPTAVKVEEKVQNICVQTVDQVDEEKTPNRCEGRRGHPYLSWMGRPEARRLQIKGYNEASIRPCLPSLPVCLQDRFFIQRLREDDSERKLPIYRLDSQPSTTISLGERPL